MTSLTIDREAFQGAGQNLLYHLDRIAGLIDGIATMNWATMIETGLASETGTDTGMGLMTVDMANGI